MTTSTVQEVDVAEMAIVAPWAVLGHGVRIHPFALVGRLPDRSAALARQPDRTTELSVGAGTIIGAHATIYGGVIIGLECLIGDYASVREGTTIGERCVVGRAVTVNYDARIGDRVRLQDGTHITGGCVIGDDCFFGVGVVTSNDRRVNPSDYAYRGCTPPVFGKRVMVGSGANILAGVTVGDDAIIGAGALVVKDVPAGATVLGTVAKVRDDHNPWLTRASKFSAKNDIELNRQIDRWEAIRFS